MPTRKKVLIITYYWPPAGGPGVQRWLKFVKYLPQFDFEPIVFVPENPSYPIVDVSLLKDVPKQVKIIKRPISEPYKLANIFSKKNSKNISRGIIRDENNQGWLEKLMLFIRGNFFIPDARIGWVAPSVAFLLDYIPKEGIDTIITTGPPHSLHLIGMRLKERLGIKWLADFRDPWTSIGYQKQLKLTRKSRLKHQRLEKEVLNSADQIVVTSQVTKKEFKIITNTPIEVITNGYDVERLLPFEVDSKFSISHIGSLLSKRNPEVLWQVLSELVQENQSFSKDLQLNFIGLLSDEVLGTIQKYNLSDYVIDLGYLSHNEAIKYQNKSQILLLIEIDSEATNCIIPGKLFEYMVSNRPIIALGPKASDVEAIIKETNTGHYFHYDQYDLLKAQIINYYKAYQKQELTSNPIGLQKYSRKALTKQLAQLIK